MGRRSRPRIYPPLDDVIRKEQKKSKLETPTQEEIRERCAEVRKGWDLDTKLLRVMDWGRIEDPELLGYAPWEVPVINVSDIDYNIANLGAKDLGHIFMPPMYYTDDAEYNMSMNLKKRKKKK